MIEFIQKILDRFRKFVTDEQWEYFNEEYAAVELTENLWLCDLCMGDYKGAKKYDRHIIKCLQQNNPDLAKKWNY